MLVKAEARPILTIDTDGTDLDGLTHYCSLAADSIIPGVLIRDGADRAEEAHTAALSVGLTGDMLQAQEFMHYKAFDGSVPEGLMPDDSGWIPMTGITALHADGNEHDRMLSVSACEMGGYDLRMFERGPELVGGLNAFDLWDAMVEPTLALYSDGVVDKELLLPVYTGARVQKGDLVIINPTFIHTAVTRAAPRRSVSVFYNQENA